MSSVDPTAPTPPPSLPPKARGLLDAIPALCPLPDIYRGVIEGRAFAMCFDPHHALRAVEGGRLVEVVICFMCSQLYVYRNGSESGYAVMSDAAREGLDRLLEPVEGGPRVAGRGLVAWIEHFEASSEGDALGPDEIEALVALAEALSEGGVRYVDLACDVLSGLGPRAAHALPGLRRALARPAPRVVAELVRVVAALGPSGAPAVPDLIAAYERDYDPFVLGDDPTDAQLDDATLVEADVVETLRFEILQALAALGSAAEPARPLAQRLASGDDPTLADAGYAILEALGGDGD